MQSVGEEIDTTSARDKWLYQLDSRMAQLEQSVADCQTDSSLKPIFEENKKIVETMLQWDIDMLSGNEEAIKMLTDIKYCLDRLVKSADVFLQLMKAAPKASPEALACISAVEHAAHALSFLACQSNSLGERLQKDFVVEAFLTCDDLAVKDDWKDRTAGQILNGNIPTSYSAIQEHLLKGLADSWLVCRLDFMMDKEDSDWKNSYQRKVLNQISLKALTLVSKKNKQEINTLALRFLQGNRPLLRLVNEENAAKDDGESEEEPQEEQVEVALSPVQPNPAWDFHDLEVINAACRLIDLDIIEDLTFCSAAILTKCAEMKIKINRAMTEPPIPQRGGIIGLVQKGKNLFRNLEQKSTKVNSILAIPVLLYSYSFFMVTLKKSVPFSASYSLQDILTYIEGQDNFLVSCFIVNVGLLILDLILDHVLTIPAKEILKGRQMGLSYLRSYLFFAVTMGFIVAVMGYRSWSSVVLDFLVLEVLAYLDKLKIGLVEMSFSIEQNVFKNCNEYGEADFLDNFAPALDTYRKDQIKVCFLGLCFLGTLHYLLASQLQNTILITALVYFASDFIGTTVLLIQLKNTVYELVKFKRISMSTLKFHIYSSVFQIVTALCAALHWQLKGLQGTFKQYMLKSIGVGVLLEIKTNIFKQVKGIRTWSQIINKFRFARPEELTEVQHCCICMDEVTTPLLTRCGHSYHWNCIVLWYTGNHSNCPYCSQPL